MSTTNRKYLIWSNEHNSWWGPNRRGYSPLIECAGKYNYEEAIEICNESNKNWDISQTRPEELPIEESMAFRLNIPKGALEWAAEIKRFDAEYPTETQQGE